MRDPRQAAQKWIDDWNRRDLDAILEHYAEDVQVCCPRVVERFGVGDGWIRGKERLREHFAIGLRQPNLASSSSRSWRG
jgi:ketosteroid isomerase-like protein